MTVLGEMPRSLASWARPSLRARRCSTSCAWGRDSPWGICACGGVCAALEPGGAGDFVAEEEAAADLGDGVVPGVVGGPGELAAEVVAGWQAKVGGGGVEFVFGEVFLQVVFEAGG